jgi:hypothetical protein
VAEHAALATVGERELAEFGWVDGVSGTGLLGEFILEAPDEMRL